MADEKDVEFRNDVSWSGERFSYTPGQTITLAQSVAKARQAAGLGEILTAKAK